MITIPLKTLFHTYSNAATRKQKKKKKTAGEAATDGER